MRARAGDIVLSALGHGFTAEVVPEDWAGEHLEAGAYLVSVDPMQFDPWFVAGVLSQTIPRAASRTSATSTSSARIDLRQFAIPVLSLAEQQTYGRAFRQLAAFQETLASAAELGAEVAQEIRAGLTAGTLDFDPL